MSSRSLVTVLTITAAAALFAACSSGGVVPGPGTNGGAPRTTQSTTGTITVSGVISSTNASQSWILIRTSQCGYEYVDYTSSTTITYNGQQMKAGTNATATGTGSCSTRIAASSITLQPPSGTSTFTVSGVIASTGTNTILLKGTQCGYEYVDYTSSTTINYNGQQMKAGTYATATGTGTCSTRVAAQTITLSSTAPTPTPSPIPVFSGEILGQDDMFTPGDGNTPSGAQNEATVDGIPCLATMTVNYHIHTHVSIFVNGNRYAVPDTIGMWHPETETNGVTNYAWCFYYLHTHDASGLIHVEASSPTTYTLGQFFDIWGEPLSYSAVGPFTGVVRAFLAPAGSNGTSSSSYTEYTGDLHAIPLNSHNEITLEVGPTYILPGQLPAYQFYTLH